MRKWTAAVRVNGPLAYVNRKQTGDRTNRGTGNFFKRRKSSQSRTTNHAFFIPASTRFGVNSPSPLLLIRAIELAHEAIVDELRRHSFLRFRNGLR